MTDNTQPIIAWFNFKTNRYDYIQGAPPNMADYIPQHPSAQGLFNVHKMIGKSEMDAAMEVLKICAGKE